MNIDFAAIRKAMAEFQLSPSVEPNDSIPVDRAFLPAGHRHVLDLKRQLVVGNRGMGKSFWSHALLSPDLRTRLADVYGHRLLKRAEVVIGFNGSEKVGAIAPTTGEIARLFAEGTSPDLIWRAVMLRAALSILKNHSTSSLRESMAILENDPGQYSLILSQLDDVLAHEKRFLLIVFDALDRLGQDWNSIFGLTRALLRLVVGLQSFSSIRAKIFMRIDQFSNKELFRFPDSSKIRNNYIDLVWRSNELYGLLLFEILRDANGGAALKTLAKRVGGESALPIGGVDSSVYVSEQVLLINGIAGEFMGSNKKRGRVYTWVPLHLSDAANTCSPRSFLTAWKKAAEHDPPPVGRAVDHLGLQDGVRSASTTRLNELYEDYPWIQPTLKALRHQLVPIERLELYELWNDNDVVGKIEKLSSNQPLKAPVGFSDEDELDIYLGQLNTLLEAMKDVSVMEERSNGKINVPDIFRVDAEILRKGGVAVPRRF